MKSEILGSFETPLVQNTTPPISYWIPAGSAKIN